MNPINKGMIRSDDLSEDAFKELSNLNFIRALAITMVVLSHLPFPREWIPDRYVLSSLGSLGVFIFFLHTATVLMMSLDRQRWEGVNKLIKHFFIRRILRIYPLSIVAVLTISIISIYSGSEISATTLFANLLLIQNLTHSASIPATLWSLPYEVQMYFVLPFLFLLLRKISRGKLLLLSCAWCIAVVIISGGAKLGFNIDLIKFSPLFISGLIAYILYDLPSAKKLHPVFLIGFCVALLFCFPLAVGFGGISLVLGWPVVMLLGVLLSLTAEIKNKITEVLVKAIAQYSYAIYLVHFPLIDLVFNYINLGFNGLKWGVFFLLLTLLSYLLHHWVELPCIRMGKRLTIR